MPSDRSAQEITAILLAGQSPRYQRIDAYERYVDGTIYEGRPGWFEETEAPLRERAPCIVDPVVRSAIHSHATFCLGDNRFPQILSLSSEDDKAFDKQFGLNPDESEIVDGVVRKIRDQVRLTTAAMQGLESAMAAGSLVTVACVDRGRLRLSFLDAKCCTPTPNAKNPDELDSIEISYRYVEDVFAAELGKWVKRVMQYRRVIDRTTDTTYVPVEVPTKADFPVPSSPDTSKTFVHNLGFVPVHWYKFLGTLSETGGLDGKPIHWGVASLIDALNFSLSQRQRAALYCGDPQMWQTGVSDEEPVAPQGRAAMAPQPTSTNPQGKAGSEWKFGSMDSAGRSRRKKGPSTVWSSSSSDAKFGMMTLPGDALDGIAENAADVRAKLCEALQIVLLDPNTLRGTADLTGKALAVLYQRQLNYCNGVREDFGRRWLLPVLNLLFRIILARTSGLYLAGVEDLRPILARFQAQDDSGSTQWFEPTLKLDWPQYFEPSDGDETVRVQMALLAWQAGMITDETMVDHIKSVFAIEDTAQYVEAIQAAKAQRQADAIATSQAMAKPTPDDSTPARPVMKPKAA